MEKTVVIKASEQEILGIINEHFGTDEESIVAVEELGNQNWVVDVSPKWAPLLNSDFITEKNTIRRYCMREALEKACKDGVLEAGEYIIDCTW